MKPDKPSGRGRKITPGAVRLSAEKSGLPLLQPDSIKNPAIRDKIAEIEPDILTVVSYGEYIPSSIYNSPSYKAINVHPSLLPRWRGASPSRYALLAGDIVTGVTIQYVHRKLDAGDILLQEKIPIDPDDDHGTLCEKLYPLGARLIVDALDGLEKGAINPVRQDESMVTQAPKITKNDLIIDWSCPAIEIRNRIRAFSPEPGCRTLYRNDNCKLLAASAEIHRLEVASDPGTIVGISKSGLDVACGDAVLTLTRLQPAGKNAMDGISFINGYRPQVGERFVAIAESDDS